MALLTTNLKGRNVTLKRLNKPDVETGLNDVRSSKQNLEKEIKEIDKQKKPLEKDLKKTRKAAIGILENNDTVNKLNNFFLDTCSSSTDVCSALHTNELFKTLNGKSSSDELLNTFIDNTTTDPSFSTPLLDYFSDGNTSITTSSETLAFFANDQELQDFRDMVIKLKVNGAQKILVDTDKGNKTTSLKNLEEQENQITKTTTGTDRFAPMILAGVQKISVMNSTTVGQEPGLVTPFLQGWYNNPIKIEVEGKSYLGAFEKILPFFPETGDTTRDDINNLFLDNDQIFKQNLSLEVEITIENEGVYEGLISDFNYNEDINEPFLINYTINFVGFRNTEKSKANGEKRSSFDLSAALNIVAGKKGLNFLLSSVTPKL